MSVESFHIIEDTDVFRSQTTTTTDEPVFQREVHDAGFVRETIELGLQLIGCLVIIWMLADVWFFIGYTRRQLRLKGYNV